MDSEDIVNEDIVNVDEEMFDLYVVDQKILLEYDQEKMDMVNLEKLVPIQVKNSTTAEEFRINYAQSHNLNPHQIRLWGFGYRKNETWRVKNVIPLEMKIHDFEFTKISTSLRIVFVEISHQPCKPFFVDVLFDETVLIFFKKFCSNKCRFYHIGYGLFDKKSSISCCVPIVKHLSGFRNTSDVQLYEEITPHRVDDLHLNDTFTAAEIQTGDILIVCSSTQNDDIRSSDFFSYQMVLFLLICFVQKNFHFNYFLGMDTIN